MNNEQYQRFVRPSSRSWSVDASTTVVGLLWAGTAADYVAQLKVFHRAVRAADPEAAVVLGGCGFDVLSSEPHGPAREFFDEVLRDGRDAFDVSPCISTTTHLDTGACRDGSRNDAIARL